MTTLVETPTPAVTERRTDCRYRPTFGTICKLTQGRDRTADGLVRDISEHGIGMLLAFAPELGRELHGDLTAEESSARLTVVMRVAHVRPLSTGDYFIGARFVEPLTAARIDPFVTPTGGRRQIVEAVDEDENISPNADNWWRNRG